MKTYDARKVVVTLAGIVLPGGFAEDDGIKIAPVEPEKWTSIVGQDGKTARSKSNNNNFRVILSLMQTSDTNDILSRLFIQDNNNPGFATGVGAFQMADLNGTTLARGPSAWIVGWPEIPRGKTVKTNSWTLEVADGYIFVGGGNPQ